MAFHFASPVGCRGSLKGEGDSKSCTICSLGERSLPTSEMKRVHGKFLKGVPGTALRVGNF